MWQTHLLILSRHANRRDQESNYGNKLMSSKKAAKIEVKLEVTGSMETQQRDSGADSDGDSHNGGVRSAASVFKKEQSEVKSEVKSEMTKMPANNASAITLIMLTAAKMKAALT
jgi:hypothetical protein